MALGKVPINGSQSASAGGSHSDSSVAVEGQKNDPYEGRSIKCSEENPILSIGRTFFEFYEAKSEQLGEELRIDRGIPFSSC